MFRVVLLFGLFAFAQFCLASRWAVGSALDAERAVVMRAVSLASEKRCAAFRGAVDSLKGDVFKEAAAWFAGARLNKCVDFDRILRTAERSFGSGKMTKGMMKEFLLLSRRQSSSLSRSQANVLFLFLEEVLQEGENVLSLDDKIVIADIFLKIGAGKDLLKRYINAIWSKERFNSGNWVSFLDKYSAFILEDAMSKNIRNMLLFGNANFLLKNESLLPQNATMSAILRYVALLEKNCQRGFFLNAAKTTNYDAVVVIPGLRSCRSVLSPEETLKLMEQVRVGGIVESKEFYDYVADFARSSGAFGSRKDLAERLLDILLRVKSLEGSSYVSYASLVGMLAMNSKRDAGPSIAALRGALRFAKAPAEVAHIRYLIGRLHSKMGDRSAALENFSIAARHPFVFYGQLAAEEVGLDPSAYALERLKEFDQILTLCPNSNSQTNIAIELGNILFGRGDKWGGFKYLDEALDILGTRSGDKGLCCLKNLVLTSKGYFGYYFGKKASYLGMPMREISFPLLGFLESSVAHAMIRQESCFADGAVSPKGALGLMQVSPRTARGVAKEVGIKLDVVKLQTNKSYNVSLGNIFFLNMNAKYKNLALALAAYNAGSGNVEKWLRSNGDPRGDKYKVLNWIESIPFKETRDYVKLVIQAKVVYDPLISSEKHERN